MQTRCRMILETACELLEFGVLREGVDTLVTLRRCAHGVGCDAWRECTCEVDGAWSRPAAAAAARPVGDEPRLRA